MLRSISLSFVILFAACTFTIAQELKPFKGLYKLIKAQYGDQAEQEMQSFNYKIFDSAGEYSNFNLTKDGLALTHKGIFNYDPKTLKYLEEVKVNDNITGPVANRKNEYTYTYDTSTKLLKIEGYVSMDNSNFKIVETWKKVGE